MIDKYYKRIGEAKTLEDLRTVYADFTQAFCDDIITIEQYHKLRMAFHNAKVLRVVD